MYTCLYTSNFILTLLFSCCCISIFAAGAPSVFHADNSVSVACQTAPPIQCPSTFHGCPGSDTTPATTGFATAQAGDADCPAPTLTFTDIETTTGACQGEVTIKRVWTASYPGNTDPWLTSNCNQLIFIADTQAPTIACPNDIVVATNCFAVSWPEAGAGDNCGIASLSPNIPSGSSFGVGTTPVTYTATDNCGNSVSCSFNVTVQGDCCGAPPITCPADFVGCIAAPVVKSETGFATSEGTDACGDALVTFSDVTVSEGPCKGEFVLDRTWTATSVQTGLTSTCLQRITAKDDTPPTIANCPANIVISTGSSCVANWSLPVANDDCGIDFFSSTHNPGQTFADGQTTTVTYTATDQCGNSTACSFTVTCDLGCQSAPGISCPVDYTGCVGTSTAPAVTGQPTVGTGSGNCQAPTVTFTDTTVSTGPCAGQVHIRRTWTATEPGSGLSSSCVQNIILEDTQVPVLSGCPADITLPANTYIATWANPTATDNCGQPTITSTYTTGDAFPVGTTPVTLTATDACGNAVSCTFNVTVVETCTTAPSLTCPQDYIGCVSSSIDPSITGLATAVATGPNCQTPNVTFEDQTISNGPCNGQTQIQRKWTATGSGSGLTSVCFQTITLQDNQAPTISGCPANITLAPNAACTPTWVAPVATDNCGIASFTSNYASGNTLPMGTTTVVYTATDNCGNDATCSFTVTCSEVCDDAPSISCPEEYRTCPGESIAPAVAGQATAIAGSSICSVPALTFSDASVPRTCPGAFTTTRTWTASDPNTGLSSACVQTIIESNPGLPRINNCPADITVATGGSNVVSWTIPIATQGCGISSFTSTHNPGDTFACGTTTVTYTAIDNCNRSVSCSFNITVGCAPTCATAPSITCPANYSACPGSSIDPTVTGQATASNNGAGCSTPAISFNDVVLQNFACTGGQEIQRTWTATNGSLSSSCVQILTLNETSGPSLTNCPADITTTNTAVSWTPPTIASGCGGYTLTSSHNPGDVFACGPTTVTYSTQDACGNVVSCSFVVNVVCNQGSGSGFSNCPDNIVVDCNSNSNVTWDVPAFSSSCSVSCDTDTIPGFIFMGQLGGSRYFCSVNPATWPDAQAHAVSVGGNLATVETAAENAYLANILTIQSAFIGCSDGVVEGDFIWTDGTPVTYTNWYPGQPNDYQQFQDYCEMLSNGQWNDQYNHVKLEYIVELSCNSIVQTQGPAPGSVFSPGSTTIEYTATDGCGNVEVCSFDVIVSGGLTLECIPDQTVEVNSISGAIITWDEPGATTCCSNCNSGSGATPGPIAGFIYMGTLGSSHYYCSNDPALWPDAQATSVANGGHLAIINSATENNFLANLLTIQSAYIGLSDAASQGTFQWVDGSGLSYTNWYAGQPNNYQSFQDYVELLADGQWNDQYNNKALEYIMEIPASCLNVVQTGGPASGSVFSPGSYTISYQATDACGNVANCSFDINVTSPSQGGNATSYCDAYGNDSSVVWINQVSFGPLNNVSGNNGGYTEFSGCSTFATGQHYNLALTPQYAAYPSADVFWSIYIDYNQDGDFNDAGEYIATGNGTQTLSGTIVIPHNAVIGNTRMRIIMKKGAVAKNSCDTFDFGEVEDYCVTIARGSVLIGDTKKSSADQTVSLLANSEAEVSIENVTVTAYPNPVTDILFVESKSMVSLRLFDAQGRTVMTRDNIKESRIAELNVSELQSGMYTLQVIDENNTPSAQRIIVHRP